MVDDLGVLFDCMCVDHNPAYAQPPSVWLVECEDRKSGIGDHWFGYGYEIVAFIFEMPYFFVETLLCLSCEY